MLKLDHICILVEDMDAAIDHYCKLLDADRKDVYLDPAFRETGEDLMKVAFIPTANAFVELIQPLAPEGNMAKVLARRGEGLHHVCLTVAPSQFYEHFKGLKEKGFKVVDEEPRHDVAYPDFPYTWLHPRVNTHGLLIEVMPHFRRLQDGTLEPVEG